MISKEKILSKLSPSDGKEKLIASNQTTNDIIKGILDTHKKFSSEYDNIYKYFIGASLKETCQNIFDFLKQNVPLKVESGKNQTLRSPRLILENPADCKSYSLFSNGVLDAYKRNENKYFTTYFRFAGYSDTSSLEHVFCVCKTNGEEFWIDPNINYFDSREKTPNFIFDKKNKPMALRQISGFPAHTQKNVSVGANSQQRAILKALKPVPAYNYYGVMGSDKPCAVGCNCNVKIGDVWADIWNFIAAQDWGTIFKGNQNTPYGQRPEVNYNDSRNTVLSNMAYLQQNQDVARNWDDTPFAHYIIFGQNENRPKWINIPSEQFTLDSWSRMKSIGDKYPGLFNDIASNKDEILKLLRNSNVSSGGGSTTTSKSILPKLGIGILIAKMLM